MKFQMICASSRAELNDQVERKIADGWERRTDVEIVDRDQTGNNIEIPEFVLFLQIVTKDN